MLDVYTVTWNEEKYIQDFIDFYKDKFKDCRITLYDNQSTDRTVDIARSNGCRVFVTNTPKHEYCDRTLLYFKNNMWKKSSKEWIAIVDPDEYVDGNNDLLINAKWNVNKCAGYDMVPDFDEQPVNDIKYGVPSVNMCKCSIFNKTHLQEINYNFGCHSASPIPQAGKNIIYNDTPFKMYHMKWRSFKYVTERHKIINDRMSTFNKKNGLSFHYSWSEQEHDKCFNNLKTQKILVR